MKARSMTIDKALRLFAPDSQTAAVAVRRLSEASTDKRSVARQPSRATGAAHNAAQVGAPLQDADWGKLARRITPADPPTGSRIVVYALPGYSQAQRWCDARERMGYRVALRSVLAFDGRIVENAACCYLLGLRGDNAHGYRVWTAYRTRGVPVQWWKPGR